MSTMNILKEMNFQERISACPLPKGKRQRIQRTLSKISNILCLSALANGHEVMLLNFFPNRICHQRFAMPDVQHAIVNYRMGKKLFGSFGDFE